MPSPAAMDPQTIDPIVNELSAKHGVDPRLVRAVLKTESNYDPQAISSTGARGLMQLMPATASRFGVLDSFDPRQNIEGGTKYLKFLLQKFNGNKDLAIAGYNAGEGLVEKLGRVPEIPETQDYLQRVKDNYGPGYQSTLTRPQSTAPTTKFSVKDVADFVRSQAPELKDQPDSVLAQFMFDYAPEAFPDTLLQGRQQASKLAFEQNLPTTARTFKGGFLGSEEVGQPSFGKLDPTQVAQLRDFILSGVEGLGIDPASPVKSGFDLVKKLGSYVAAPFQTTPGERPEFSPTSLGDVARSAIAGPSRLVSARTPQEFAEGAGQTTAQTLPLIEGAGSFAKAGMFRALSDDPAVWMKKAADVRGGTASVESETSILNELSKTPGSVGSTARALQMLGKRAKEPLARFYENIAKGIAGPSKIPPPPTLPEKTGFVGPLQREIEPGFEPFNPSTASGQFKQPTKTPEIEAPGLLQKMRPGFKEPGATTAAPADLFKEVQSGIPAETHQLLGKAKLNNIARDAETILNEQGYNVVDKIDSMVGGKSVRQRLLATPEGQNTIANFTTALRQMNPKYMMWWGGRLQELVNRTANRTIIPPPPG